MYSVNGEANGSESHKSCDVVVFFPSADLGKVAGWEAWLARGKKASYDI